MATRRCTRGRKKSGACKRKPGPKRGSKKRRSRSRSGSRKSKCRHGRKKTGRRGCKAKPGKKRGSRKRRRSKRRNRFGGCGAPGSEAYGSCNTEPYEKHP